MKKYILSLLTICFFGTLFSQISLTEAEHQQKAFGKEKKHIIQSKIKLSDKESKKFWDVYAEYEKSRETYSQNRLKLLQKYADQTVAVNNEQLTQIVNDLVKNHNDFDALLQSTYKKMSKAVGGIKAAEFIQIESYLESLLRVQIYQSIPFLYDFKK